MIYYTGDIHGRPQGIQEYFEKHAHSQDDTLVILGDVGANYYRNKTDKKVKKALDSLGLTVLCIHGNHEIRPANIPTYQQKEWNGGLVWYEPEFPNLLFARDGEIFTIRKYIDQLKADRLLSLVTLPGYFPYRGYLTCDSKPKSLLHTGLHIKYPKSSNRQKRLKRQAAKKVRNNPISGKGNHYRRVFDYRWELD